MKTSGKILSLDLTKGNKQCIVNFAENPIFSIEIYIPSDNSTLIKYPRPHTEMTDYAIGRDGELSAQPNRQSHLTTSNVKLRQVSPLFIKKILTEFVF